MENSRVLEDLLTDLIYLRKDAGFTPRRFRQASVLLHVLGGNPTFEECQNRLLSAIYALPSQQDTEILLAALALTSEYKGLTPLKKRREKLSQESGLSADTIADYETAALNELAVFLISARYARSALPEGVPAMHDVAVHESVRIVTLVRDRLWQETREYYRTIPLIDGVEYFEISSDIPARITASSAKVVNSETTSNGLRHRFHFAEPLKRGKAEELSFVMQPNGINDAELVLKEETRAFHLPTIAAEMEILFLGDKPKTMWHYTNLPVFERPGLPEKDRLLNMHGGSSVRVRWDDLYGGLYSGIAWSWE